MGHDSELALRIEAGRENATYLPGFVLPGNVTTTASLETALAGAGIILGVMPSQFARPVYSGMLPYLRPDMGFVTATKGIEQGTLLRMSEVVGQVAARVDGAPVAVLSGPAFAREVARGTPAALVIASTDAAFCSTIQEGFAGPALRLYRNSDPVGVEMGAALKNVIAIAAGICQGLELGSNALAALVTRGLAEITRLAVAMGGRPATLAGLSGLGDLVLTCIGDLSRNRQVGMELAKGRDLAEIQASTRMIAEGVATTSAAVLLAERYGVEMPIAQQMGYILRGGQSPRAALADLMQRSLKDEEG